MGALMAGLDDLAAMKLSAIAQRGAKKDFVDIAAIGRKHASLSDMLRCYQKKYAIKNIAHVLYGLAYFDDANAQLMPKMLWKLPWAEVRTTVERWGKSLAE